MPQFHPNAIFERTSICTLIAVGLLTGCSVKTSPKSEMPGSVTIVNESGLAAPTWPSPPPSPSAGTATPMPTPSEPTAKSCSAADRSEAESAVAKATDLNSAFLDSAMLTTSGVLACLVEMGADPKTSTAGGGALQNAVYNDHSIDVLKYLIEELHLDVNFQPLIDGDFRGATALQENAFGDDIATERYLLSKGADVSRPDFIGGRPLLAAAFSGSVDMIKLLIASGADVKSVEGATGRTVLMKAASNNSFEVVDLLIGLFDSRSATDVNGLTAYDIAVEQKRDAKIVARLRR